MGYSVDRLWHKETSVEGYDAIVLPGGFSYGDYLRPGAMACFSPIMASVLSYAEQGGNVLGICNGFQILCESGLLPGALRANRQQRFVCRTVELLPEVKNFLPTRYLENGRVLRIPIAHADGAYFADDETMARLRVKNQILFRYCDPDGQVRDRVNPNGSLDNIAGICNEKGNVIGMMPHPERASWDRQGNTDGLRILESIFRFWGA